MAEPHVTELHLSCGSYIRRDTPNCTTVHVTDSHICGGHGYGEPGDRCPACDKGERLHRLLRKAEGRATHGE